MKTAIKNINIENKKTAVVNLPLTAFRYLYSAAKGKKIVVELDINSLKKVNKQGIIDRMASEAKLEYLAGKLKGFTNTKKLINHLNA